MLANALWVDVVSEPTGRDYVLWPGDGRPHPTGSFIPSTAITIAADKRLQASVFAACAVNTPETVLCETASDVDAVIATRLDHRWVLKYPTGCGATGHRFIADASEIPADWPTPYVLQQFISLERPEVYRLYGVAGTLFGFNARRFPAGTTASPWVAHARGARYEHGEVAPAEALEQAERALVATGLWSSFGCVDLLRSTDGRWLVLEVGTDGIVNHVDRELGDQQVLDELNRRLAEAFWQPLGNPPWGRTWRYRTHQST